MRDVTSVELETVERREAPSANTKNLPEGVAGGKGTYANGSLDLHLLRFDTSRIHVRVGHGQHLQLLSLSNVHQRQPLFSRGKKPKTQKKGSEPLVQRLETTTQRPHSVP